MLLYGLTSCKKRETANFNKDIPVSLYFEDNDDVEDLLGYQKMAETLSSIIQNDYSHKNHAIGIAVTGDWGTGKSTFLYFLDRALDNGIKVKFDPWTENSNDVTADLLDKIEQEIRRENISAAITFRRYFNKLNVTNVTGWFNLSILAIQNFFNSETSDAQKTNLKEVLTELDKPVVIFIDDSDRLPSDQFLKIISIIKGLADLPNVVFIVAYDQKRANEKLKEYGGEDFTRKLFNVIHPLQPINENIILSELCRNISFIIKGNPTDIDTTLHQIIYDTLRGISIKQYLPTLRELKRFCNVIEKDYSMIRDSESIHYIDIRQWLLIELIKYTDIATYNMVGANPEAYLKKNYIFGLNSPYYQLKDGTVVGKPESQKLLNLLFPKEIEQKNDTILISNPCYFKLYFGWKFPNDYITDDVADRYSINKDDTETISLLKSDAFRNFFHDNSANYKKSNIESVVSEILKTYPATLLYPVLESIIREYASLLPNIGNFSELDERDNYRKYSRIVNEHISLSVLSFNALDEFYNFDSHKGVSDDCILKSEYPLILCALFNQHIRNWDYDGRIGSDRYLFSLLKKLVNEGNHQDVIWAVADCISADLPKSFLDEYLDSHLINCLPYIIWWKKDFDTGEKLIYADLNAFEGLFLSYERFKSTITRFKWKKTYSEDLLNELRRLVDVSNLWGRSSEFIKAKSFPLLSAYLREDQHVLSNEHLKSESFWEDGDRLER